MPFIKPRRRFAYAALSVCSVALAGPGAATHTAPGPPTKRIDP